MWHCLPSSTIPQCFVQISKDTSSLAREGIIAHHLAASIVFGVIAAGVHHDFSSWDSLSIGNVSIYGGLFLRTVGRVCSHGGLHAPTVSMPILKGGFSGVASGLQYSSIPGQPPQTTDTTAVSADFSEYFVSL